MPCVGSAWGRAARRLQGWACGRAWFGSGAGSGQPRIGTRACQTRIGKWPGQIRIGNTGGSNPKRERAAPKKEKTTRGCWFLPAAFYWGFNQGFYWAAKNLGFYPGFYLGLVAPGFYLGKNLGRSPGAACTHCLHTHIIMNTWHCKVSREQCATCTRLLHPTAPCCTLPPVTCRTLLRATRY